MNETFALLCEALISSWLDAGVKEENLPAGLLESKELVLTSRLLNLLPVMYDCTHGFRNLLSRRTRRTCATHDSGREMALSGHVVMACESSVF